MRPSHRRVPAGIRYLKTTRRFLEELRDTLEPVFPILDMLIVRELLIYLLLEKAGTIVR